MLEYDVTSMRVLTIYEPWATLIAQKRKGYEYRGEQTSRWAKKNMIGRRLAIHAAVKPIKPGCFAAEHLMASLGHPRSTMVACSRW
jgi:hypothetical protein